MDKALATVIGMSIAYVASFLGMGLAWWSWRKRKGTSPPDEGSR